MRKFVTKMALFVVVAVVLGAALDGVITTGLHRRTDYVQEVWNDVMDPTVAPDLVVLGNCVAAYDHNPQVLDSVLGTDSYVFAMSNLTFPYHNFMWNMLRKYHPHTPRLVVLALDYSDMCCREAKTNMENEQFLALMHDGDARRFLLQYGGYSWLDAYLPCYRYFGHHKRIKYGVYNFLGVKKYAGSPDHYKGYKGLGGPYNAHREWFDGDFEQPIEPQVVAMLDTFLTGCNKSGIEVLMVLPPIVYELSDRVVNEAVVYRVYDSLAHAHGFECVHYVEPHWLSMDTSHFESPNHLNKQMSDVYTADLAQYIATHYNL